MSAKPRGLGRGLDALLPRAEGGRQVAISSLTVSPLQPRRRFDEASMAELAASIGSKGVLQPLLVRPAGEGYEIVAGERRYRAAQQAGLDRVPVVVRELSDQETLEIAIVENLQREDLNPIDEARAYRQLLDFGLTQEAVAQAVGKSRSAVANSLRLLHLPELALDAVERGVISAGHARAVLAQEPEDRAWALEQVLSRGLSVRQAEALRRPTAASRGRAAERDQRYAGLADDLTRFVGSRVRVRGGTKGTIELHFHDRDELQRLLDLLGYRP